MSQAEGATWPVLQRVSSTLVSGNNSLALVFRRAGGSLSTAAALLGAAHPLPVSASSNAHS
jgi:hypothetical protein